MRQSQRVIFLSALAGLLLLSPLAAQAQDDSARAAKDAQAEQKMGKDEADSVEKSVKMVTDKAMIARVAAIGARLAAVANNQHVPAGYGNSYVAKFDYTYKIIDDKEVNAFSIPGGHIFIYKGMMDLIKTDDELAGVLGHETAHAAHHHVIALTHQESKMSTEAMLGYIAAILSHSADAMNAAAFGGYLQQAQLNNQYGEAAEEDADHAGMIYMQRAGFNPVGMLTMLQRLKDLEDRSPTVELGFLRDHPLSADRVVAAKAELSSLGVTVNEANLRAASGSLRVALLPDSSAADPAKPLRLIVGDQTVCVLAGDSRPEAQSAADALNKLLNQNLQLYEVKSEGNALVVRGQTLLQVSPADVAAASAAPLLPDSESSMPSGSEKPRATAVVSAPPDAVPVASLPKTPEGMASDAAHAIQRALWQQTVRGVGGS